MTKKLKGAKGIIDLAVFDLDRSITRKSQQAEIHGPLAIFKIQFGWNITHVRTGLRVMDVIGTKSSHSANRSNLARGGLRFWRVWRSGYAESAT